MCLPLGSILYFHALLHASYTYGICSTVLCHGALYKCYIQRIFRACANAGIQASQFYALIILTKLVYSSYYH